MGTITGHVRQLTAADQPAIRGALLGFAMGEAIGQRAIGATYAKRSRFGRRTERRLQWADQADPGLAQTTRLALGNCSGPTVLWDAIEGNLVGSSSETLADQISFAFLLMSLAGDGVTDVQQSVSGAIESVATSPIGSDAASLIEQLDAVARWDQAGPAPVDQGFAQNATAIVRGLRLFLTSPTNPTAVLESTTGQGPDVGAIAGAFVGAANGAHRLSATMCRALPVNQLNVEADDIAASLGGTLITDA